MLGSVSLKASKDDFYVQTRAFRIMNKDVNDIISGASDGIHN